MIKNILNNKKYLFLIILCLSLTSIYLLYRIQTKTINETESTEMQNIPIQTIPTVHHEIDLNVQIPIFMYHYIEIVKDKNDTIRQTLAISPSIFELQIQTLLKNGYTFIMAKDIGKALNGTLKLPQKPFLLTFDDGHWDLDTDVLPILKKYNIKATAYIISGFIGRSDFLSQKQLDDVVKSGLIEIGVHTVHHVSLKGKLQPIVQMEVAQSKKTLEDLTHIPIVSFAYPNGSFDDLTLSEVNQAGFQTAVSTIPGITVTQNNKFFLYRVRPGNRTGEALITYLKNIKDKKTN
jgi:peptidoglycan/xylan/chitin deacetylase (PgdA/CDA1 family)